jgi:hypothetical protein
MSVHLVAIVLRHCVCWCCWVFMVGCIMKLGPDLEGKPQGCASVEYVYQLDIPTFSFYTDIVQTLNT